MMASASHNPAVVAGLAGAFAVPVSGMAAVALSDANSLQAPFALGCMSGAVIMCGVSLGIVVHEHRARELDALRVGGRAGLRPAPAHAPQRPAVRHGAGHAASVTRGRHMGTVDWERTGTIRVQRPAAPRRPAPSPSETADYVALAMRPETPGRRARGVREVLLERLGAGIADPVPVIERAGVAAAGSTASFAASPADSSAADTTDLGRRRRPAPRHMAPAPPDVGATVAATGGAWSLSTPAPDRLAQAGRAASIARRVAEIDLGAFPERGGGAEPGVTESFSRALAAMDERFVSGAPQPVPVFEAPAAFSDAVGGTDTLDEPLGLEPSTDFLAFRVPAGHPEVVDEQSYVDYLIGEEFAANPSSTVRRSSRDFLRVIQGGQDASAERYAQAL